MRHHTMDLIVQGPGPLRPCDSSFKPLIVCFSVTVYNPRVLNLVRLKFHPRWPNSQQEYFGQVPRCSDFYLRALDPQRYVQRYVQRLGGKHKLTSQNVCTDNQTHSPDTSRMEGDCSRPGMIYRAASDDFDRQKPAKPRQLFTEPDLGLDQNGASDETSRRFPEGLHHLPNEKVKPVERRGIKVHKVHDVVGINFWDKYLNESDLEVKYEFEGKRKKAFFSYDEIRDVDGTQNALKRFRPLFTEEKAR